jgi:hypothetical protein
MGQVGLEGLSPPTRGGKGARMAPAGLNPGLEGANRKFATGRESYLLDAAKAASGTKKAHKTG